MTRLRRAVVTIFGIALGLVVVFVGGTLLYHWNRFRSCAAAIRLAQAERIRYPNSRAEWEVPFETFTSSQVDELRASASRWHQKVEEIVSKGRVSTQTRVFFVGDMIYFVFYGPDDRITDFACVGN